MSRAVLVILLSLPMASFALAAEPSSEIPDRREFPVDAAVKPCTDFYAYACNGVLSTFKLRDDRSAHTFSFSDSSERLLKAKEKYFADLAANHDEPEPRTRAMRDFYRGCMDEVAAKKDERDYVDEVLTGMKGVGDAAAFRAFADARELTGDFALMGFGEIANQDDPDQYDLYFLADAKTLPERSYYDKRAVVEELKMVLAKFFAVVGFDAPEKRAHRVLEFEKEFAQSYPLPAEFRELFSSKTGIARSDLTARFAHLPLATVLAKAPIKTHIRDLTPKNFAWLDAKLATKSAEDLATLKDVYVWHALSGVLDDAYPDFFDSYFRFANHHLGGPEKRAPRGERCTRRTMELFGRELDHELVDKIFPGFPTEKFVKLAERVRGEIVKGLEHNVWLTPPARALAAQKMRVARLQLVKPATDEEWDFNLPATYDAARPVHNMVTWDQKRIEKMLGRFGVPRNRKQWDMGPLTVNAYYSASDNKFVMPIGILQYPFFDPAAPDEQNLGAIGAVIGHELGHGIDDKGSKYDETGRLTQWMGALDLKEFRRRTARLVAQFDRAGHNGKLTLGENIGDLVGLTFAYRAAFPDGKGGAAEKRAFFTQFGRAWCNVIRPKFKELRLKTDPHALGEARVNEQVKHQPGFAEAFECKAGDKLYLAPKDRVAIW